jgi:DNA invertase Pin-like site-specific DNA recombinase
MTSLDDQIRVCSDYIARNGDTLVDGFIFQDAAVSGASEAGRDGLARMKEAVCRRPKSVDYLAVMDLSRLNRDLADFAAMLKELRYFDVELVSVADGMRSSDPSAKVGLVFKSLMNEMYITDLAHKTREGQVGQAQRGFATGGKTFGYRTQSTPKQAGERDRKRNSVISIDEEQAKVVRRIFALLRDGKPIETIVRILNNEGAASPDPGQRGERRPRGWTYSSLRALARNPKYAGTWAFKQSYFVKSPETGKRQRRMLPPEEWLVTERPELAIVSKAEFDAVQKVLDERSARYRRTSGGKLAGTKPGSTRASYVLSGIAKCGVCGSAMSVYGGKRSKDLTKVYRSYRCPAAARSGPTICTNDKTISREKLEDAVFGFFDEKLLSEEAIAFFEAEFRAAFTKAQEDDGRAAKVAELERDIDAQKTRIERLLDAVEAGESKSVRARIQSAEAQLEAMNAQLAEMLARPRPPAPVPTSRLIGQALRELKRMLETRPEDAKDMLRTLVGELKLTPRESADVGKNETRSTFYEVSGSAFLQNLLIPLRGEAAVLPAGSCGGRI